MPIPKYETVMLPLLRMLEDGTARKFGDLVLVLEDQFNLDQTEREQMLPRGRITTFRSRIHWAATYMAQAGIVQRPQRGWLQITQRGTDVLARQPQNIDNEFLNQFPEFRDFRARSGVNVSSAGAVLETPRSSSNELSPEETLESSYQTLRLQLADDLLDRLRNGSPRFFEQVVVDLLVAMGYGGSRPGVAQAIGRTGDGGIDGVINEDKLGLDVVYVQAKRWANPVGSPTVHGFTGSLEGQRANKGVLITTSTFTKDAREFVHMIGKRIVLIDGQELAGYMIDHDVGVTSAAAYVVKRIDGDYFEEP
ncbi:restriction endonuclease [soil metagenome]